MIQATHALFNRQNGEIGIQVYPLTEMHEFREMRRHNYYSMILLMEGETQLDVDLITHDVTAPSMICLSPFQPYRIQQEGLLKGWVLNFHPDFFCTYRYQNEVETEGTLFHNIYNPPFFEVHQTAKLLDLLHQMRLEIEKNELALHEVLVSYIKIFLIQVLREKQKTWIEEPILMVSDNKEPQIIQQFVDLIEKEYRTMHSPSEYAAALHISPNALAKMVKKYFQKTLTEMIAQRIVIEAKRELYLTGKTVKEIAYALGYKDEFYFSRFFKKHVQISPQAYRETVGFDKLRIVGLA